MMVKTSSSFNKVSKNKRTKKTKINKRTKKTKVNKRYKQTNGDKKIIKKIINDKQVKIIKTNTKSKKAYGHLQRKTRLNAHRVLNNDLIFSKIIASDKHTFIGKNYFIEEIKLIYVPNKNIVTLYIKIVDKQPIERNNISEKLIEQKINEIIDYASKYYLMLDSKEYSKIRNNIFINNYYKEFMKDSVDGNKVTCKIYNDNVCNSDDKINDDLILNNFNNFKESKIKAYVFDNLENINVYLYRVIPPNTPQNDLSKIKTIIQSNPSNINFGKLKVPSWGYDRPNQNGFSPNNWMFPEAI